MSPAARQVSIRMYDVGFGDSFLLTFPAPDRPRKVLIDCGCHVAGPPEARPFGEVVARILEDIKEDGAPRLDVVVASHRHRDHVLGFERAEWSTVRVSEVWMPWTEHPTDAEARRIREAQARKAQALALALAGSGVPGAAAARARQLVENNLTNAKAMAMLHGGFAGNPPARFLPEKPPPPGGPLLPQQLKPDSLPGVTVHVLGPARDRDTIRDMDPPEGESYLRLAQGSDRGGPAALDARWAIAPRGKGFGKWFQAMEGKAQKAGFDPLQPLSASDPKFLAKWFASLGLDWRDLQKVERFATEDPLAAAVALEQAVNGTSLMLAFEVGRAMLLFPGDAQWGTWQRAMSDPASRGILERSSFLKVGHHGSHNASPRSFVEGVLGSDFSAMVSTRATKLYRNIPRLPLLAELAARQTTPRIARSDVAAVPPSFVRINDICIEARIPV